MKIQIKRSAHGSANYCAYKGGDLFATLHGEKPTKSNGRSDAWNVCYWTGRVEWFASLKEARDYALKG